MSLRANSAPFWREWFLAYQILANPGPSGDFPPCLAWSPCLSRSPPRAPLPRSLQGEPLSGGTRILLTCGQLRGLQVLPEITAQRS